MLWRRTCEGATSTPDAWRFDANGCQGSPFVRILITPPAGTCSALWGSGPEPNSLKFLAHGPLDGVSPPGAMRLVTAVTYPGTLQVPDSAQRYFMFAVRFDHSHSVSGPGVPGVTCGGYEAPMCFALWAGAGAGACPGPRESHMHYTDTNGTEQPLEPGQGYATFGLEPATAFSCFEVTPAQSTTWGQIKAQYR